jgi:regulator of replication initiation timing
MKGDMEYRISKLEEEKGQLIQDIDYLSKKLTSLELESKAKMLEKEVSQLRTEKSTLEEKVASFEVPSEVVVEPAVQAPIAPEQAPSENPQPAQPELVIQVQSS